jgi:hypothetical protein
MHTVILKIGSYSSHLSLGWPGLGPSYFSLPAIAGMIGMNHRDQQLVEMESQEHFARLASNHDSQDLGFPSN